MAQNHYDDGIFLLCSMHSSTADDTNESANLINVFFIKMALASDPFFKKWVVHQHRIPSVNTLCHEKLTNLEDKTVIKQVHSCLQGHC